jgi:hypothetical protein
VGAGDRKLQGITKWPDAKCTAYPSEQTQSGTLSIRYSLIRK